jgi:hypothetical protein
MTRKSPVVGLLRELQFSPGLPLHREWTRIAPAGTWNHMSDSNPTAVFTCVAEQLNRFGLAYLHIIEPRVKGNVTINKGQGPIAAEQLRKVFKGKIIAAGGFEPDTAETTIENGVAVPWPSDVTSWQIPICRCAQRKALRSHRMTQIPSTPSTRWAITTTPSSTNWRPARVLEEPTKAFFARMDYIRIARDQPTIRHWGACPKFSLSIGDLSPVDSGKALLNL